MYIMLPMQLRDYIQDKGITYADFAEQIGVTKTSVYRYVAGLTRPANDVLPKIKEATKGLVTPNDFFALNESGGGHE